MNNRVTVITVCYNSMAVLPDMLNSLPPETPIVLVDNSSDDRTALQALAQSHNATLILNDENAGFGSTCNQGAAKADTEFLLFLNPDAAVQPGAIEALIAASETHPTASGFNPRIVDGKGKQSFRRGSKIKPDERLKGPLPTADAEVSVLAGSAIFCRRSLFETIDGFDPAIFMYHEDDDLSFRLRDHGPLIYCHAAQVVHLSGHGSPRVPATAGFKAYHSARSRAYVQRKYGHALSELKTLLAAVFRTLGPDTLFIKRRRAKNIGYLKGAVSALRDGGRHTALK